MFAIIIGLLTAIAIYIVTLRLGASRFMGHPALTSALVVFLLVVMLHGTYVGMVAAVVGGLFFEGIITMHRKAFGYERLTIKGWKRTESSFSQKLKQKSQTLKKSTTAIKERHTPNE